MDVLTMATGREINVAAVMQDNYLHVIHIYVCEMSVVEIATVFSDESETATMSYGDKEFIGYTKIKAISPMSDWTNVIMGVQNG